MLHYLPALTHPSSSPFLILVRQNSSTTQVLVFPHDSHFFLLILVWKSLDQIGSTIYTCNNHPQPQNFIGFNPVDGPRSYHIHTGRQKREFFCLPFLSQKQASKQAHSTTLLLSCIKERKKKKGRARIPRTSGPGRRLSAIYGGAICCNCDICESSWRSIIIIPLLMATVNSVLISSRNPWVSSTCISHQHRIQSSEQKTHRNAEIPSPNLMHGRCKKQETETTMQQMRH